MFDTPIDNEYRDYSEERGRERPVTTREPAESLKKGYKIGLKR